MTSLYTRKGDNGTSGLLGAKRYKKSDITFEVIGTLDELTAHIGAVKCQISEKSVRTSLETIQRDLYAMMTDIASSRQESDKFKAFPAERVEYIEESIGTWEKEIVLPSEFILPGETAVSAAFSICRTITRRAERRLVEFYEDEPTGNKELLRYVNRLSSLMYVLEIKYSKKGGKQKLKFAKV